MRVRLLAAQRPECAQTVEHLHARLEPVRARQAAQHRAERLGIDPDRPVRQDGRFGSHLPSVRKDVRDRQPEPLSHVPVVRVVSRCDLYCTCISNMQCRSEIRLLCTRYD